MYTGLVFGHVSNSRIDMSVFLSVGSFYVASVYMRIKCEEETKNVFKNLVYKPQYFCKPSNNFGAGIKTNHFDSGAQIVKFQYSTLAV